ncbi:uncharacterized protein LOC119093517 [Pollicipes pollicipes]|uniref:uncharacterized protein LOC119093517 n=1 Tax=Pollicipes pollicipes TaxID=41117 RepID=UPI0018856D3A|nr:uncharacterized protein LOC119093517 [Pollicipes pollicipes]
MDLRHASLKALVLAVYYYAAQAPLYLVARESGLSQQTLVDWTNFLREIWSDQWAGYGLLAVAGFVHRTVNHSVEFVRADGVNTNTVEGMWSVMKAKLKRTRGTSRQILPSYLDEHMWLKRHGRSNTFPELLRAIRQQYPV